MPIGGSGSCLVVVGGVPKRLELGVLPVGVVVVDIVAEGDGRGVGAA